VSENLDELTKAELQDKADELGIEYSESDTKADLVSKIEDAESGVDEEDTGDETPPAASYASEDFPERRPVDIDVADIEPAEYEGETMAPLNAESWVVLDGDHDSVPDELDGEVAAVVDWPVGVEHDSDTGETKVFAAPDGYYLVVTRGQNIRLSLPYDAFKEVHTHGRPATYA
jgi:hypothetical protein